MKKFTRLFLAIVTTACGIGIGAGTSNSASSSYAETNDLTDQRSSSGSAAGGATGESIAGVAGVAEKCSDRKQPGACSSIKRAFTVERVDLRGTIGTGTGGATGTGTGGTLNGDSGEIQDDRDSEGATGESGVDRGDGVTGSDR